MIQHEVDQENYFTQIYTQNQQKVKQTSSTNQTNRYHPTIKDTKHQKEGKSPIRSESNTNQNEDEQLKAQIEKLKEELKVLKNNKKTETTKNEDTFTLTETPKENSKNLQMASDSQGGQQQNMEIIEVIIKYS